MPTRFKMKSNHNKNYKEEYTETRGCCGRSRSGRKIVSGKSRSGSKSRPRSKSLDLLPQYHPHTDWQEQAQSDNQTTNKETFEDQSRNGSLAQLVTPRNSDTADTEQAQSDNQTTNKE